MVHHVGQIHELTTRADLLRTELPTLKRDKRAKISIALVTSTLIPGPT
jgi:hypothetical protein